MRKPPSKKVYVPLAISGRFHQAGFGSGFTGGLSEAMGKAEADGTAKPAYIWDLLRQIEQRPEYRQLAIIARGGFGKTTLLRHVTYRYSHEPHRICREQQVPKLIPILLFLRDCQGKIVGPEAKDLPTLIAEYHVKNLSSKLSDLDVNWATNLLNSGKALVMLDGLDEVTVSRCAAVSEWIDRAVQDYGEKATFILTTRPAGHQRYEGQSFTAVTVEEFSAKQRNKFLQQWYLSQVKNERIVGDIDGAEEEAAREANDLIAQIEGRDELIKMADNPLLLCMMATFHRINPARHLPLARHRLYQGFCQMLLGDRPLSKKIQMALSVEERQAVLRGVALAMVQQECTALSVPEMTELVAHNLSRCVESVGEIGVSSGEFVKEIEDVSELLVRRQASDEYEFAHRSFQEYLAAVEIKERKQEDVLLALADTEWRDTVVLYAALANPTSLIEQLCDKSAEAQSPEQARKILELAYDCWLENNRAVPGETFSRMQSLCYAELKKCMIAGDWREADQYTYRLMIQVLSKRYGGYFTSEELMTFPCKDLLQIDGLWVQHSQGRFGFSVQKKIYVACGGPLDGKYHIEPYADFFREVGWCEEVSNPYDGIKEIFDKQTCMRPYDKLIFSTKAPKGHLPASWDSCERVSRILSHKKL